MRASSTNEARTTVVCGTGPMHTMHTNGVQEFVGEEGSVREGVKGWIGEDGWIVYAASPFWLFILAKS